MKKIEGFKIIVMSFFLLLGNISLAAITLKNCHKEYLTKVFAKERTSKKQLIFKMKLKSSSPKIFNYQS